MRYRAAMAEILQHSVPYDVMVPLPLPGVRPLGDDPWILVDEAYGAQMQRRAALLAGPRERVLYLEEGARAAAVELLHAVLDLLRSRFDAQFQVSAQEVVRPDGVRVPIDAGDPLHTLGQLVQEDFCILQKRGEEHVMTGAVLCFPAGWWLKDKAGRPLSGIHEPVAPYDETMTRRVQRLFDGVQSGRGMWRFNALWYQDPELHQPELPPMAGRDVRGPETCDYLRSERQCILRLPVSDAVVFSIHSFVLKSPNRRG